MKVTVNPPTPPEPTYVLELTKDQLVALGVLSHRHEVKHRSDPKWGGPRTFLACLPPDVQNEVVEALHAVKRRTEGHIVGVSVIDVDWGQNP